MTPEAPLLPASAEALAELVRGARRRVVLLGGGSKPALVPPPAPGDLLVSTRRLAGITAYDPAEYTLTAAAGTTISVLANSLAEHGQYLPFDPPFASRGASLGGAIASGLAGPGRVRFGGARDFVLAVRYIDGRGRLLRAGARVVKNAAGFDVPKLLVGSLGRLAAIAEVTIKVLPCPVAYATERFDLPGLDDARSALARVLACPFDLEGLELLPPGSLLVRVGGAAASLDARLVRIAAAIGERGVRQPGDAALWRRLTDGEDLGANSALIKVPMAPSRVGDLEALCSAIGAARRYSAGAAQAWIAVEASEPAIDLAAQALRERGLGGLLVRGPGRDDPRLGTVIGAGFLGRVKAALDPASRFPAFVSGAG